MPTLIADRRLYVTDDRSEVVEEGDPKGAWLLAGVGSQIGEGDVVRYGLSMKDGRVHYGGPSDAEPEAKQAAKPEDKQAPSPENKTVGGSSASSTGLEDLDLDALTKEDLVALAEDRGVEVTRADGKEGAPLKSDYVRALSA